MGNEFAPDFTVRPAIGVAMLLLLVALTLERSRENSLTKRFLTGWLPIGRAVALWVAFPVALSLLWSLWLLIALLPVPIPIRARWTWALRKGFWDLIATVKFRSNRPVTIPEPGRICCWRWIRASLFRKTLQNIDRVPFNAIFPSIRICNIKVAGHEPSDEWDAPMRVFTWFQVKLYSLFSPMQKGLPPIDPDPYEALRYAYTRRHRTLFSPPVMPLEFQGSPDLGALAVKGPYACYLKRYEPGKEQDKDIKDWAFPDFRNYADRLYEWDFRDLKKYEHHDGVYNLGSRVLFLADHTIHAVRIKSELGVSCPGDAQWAFSKHLALCAATNHLSLVRHFNGVHLASGAHLAIATRNHLFPDHALCRLLWPYIFRTQQSNRAVTLAQMSKGGDFESIFSYTHAGMCDLFSSTYGQYRFIVNDPEQDAGDRGILKAGFETPTQSDLQTLFDVMLRHAERYLAIYYTTSAAVQGDLSVLKWLDDLNHPENGIPNGLPVNRDNVTVGNLSRLIAGFMYLATVQHDIVGSFLWNYQLWAHRQPPRIYRNGTRLPLDVYQRLVNANFNLNVKRTPLMQDFSGLARPDLVPTDGTRKRAEDALQEFQRDVADLEAAWRREPWSVWRVYPSMLEANINA